MFRFYFKLFTLLFFLGIIDHSFAQKKLAHAPTVRKKSEIKAEYSFIKGEDHFLQHNYKKAIDFFLEAEKNSPKNATIQYKIAECYFLLDNSDKALSFIKKAIHLDKQVLDFYLLLSNIYLNTKDYEHSASSYEQLIENVTNTQQYYADLAHIYQQILVLELQQNEVEVNKKKKRKSERKIYDFTVKTLDAYTNFEKYHGYDAKITDQKQKLWLLINKFDKAFQEGENFIIHYPNHINFILNQSQLLYSHSKKKEAIEYLENKRKLHPTNTEIQLTLVEYYKANNQEKDANKIIHDIFDNKQISIDKKVNIISFYLQREKGTIYKDLLYSLGEKVVKFHEEDAKSYSLLGDIFYTYHDIKNAQNQYLKAVEIETNRALIWQQIILIDAELEDYSNIITHTSTALKTIPDNPTFWLYKGVAHSMKKNAQEAISAFENGVKYSTDNPALSQKFYAQLGDLYHEVKEYKKSYSSYDKALEYDPNNAHVLNNYSYFLSLKKEKLSKAKSMSQHLVRMFPNEATYLDTHAWVLYMLKDYKEAKNHLEKALQFSDDGTITEHYGDVLFQLNQKDDALVQWQKAKAKGGTSNLIDKKITDKILYEE